MTGTYDALQIGEEFDTPSRAVEPADVATLIAVGGYTHPLFTDPAFAASTPLGRSPIPGEGVLHLMGGLVEQSGRFDDTVIALLGFSSVTFPSPAFAEDTLTVRVRVDGKQERSSGARGVLLMTWTCRNAAGNVVCEAAASMLFTR